MYQGSARFCPKESKEHTYQPKPRTLAIPINILTKEYNCCERQQANLSKQKYQLTTQTVESH